MRVNTSTPSPILLSWEEMIKNEGVYRHSSNNSYKDFRFVVTTALAQAVLVYAKDQESVQICENGCGWERPINGHKFIRIPNATVNFSINE
jgi:predicted RNA-binding Zn ribbon-like protein